MADQLYTAALSSCLHQAVVIVATQHHVDPGDSQVRVEVRLRHDGRLRYSVDASVAVELPNCPPDSYDEVVRRAMAECPMVGNVEVHLDKAS